jgi:tripartite-type tricarboxylate transporter receptor subunit TctC
MAYPDILGGQVQLTFASIISALPYAKSGRLRAVAVTSRARAKALPETPSLHEAGIPGFDVTQWYGLFAPAETPRAIVERLHQETAALLRLPDVTARMAADGSEAVGSTPQAFAAHVRSELAKWGGVIRQAGIRVE